MKEKKNFSLVNLEKKIMKSLVLRFDRRRFGSNLLMKRISIIIEEEKVRF
jgi:hypothetical protein